MNCKTDEQSDVQIAIRCNKCKRIVAYKIVAGTGCIQIKCPKCGNEMVVDLSLRKAKGRLFFRMSVPVT